MKQKMNISNNNYSDSMIVSSYVLNFSKKLNVLGMLIVIAIGLLGNCLTIFVFAQKRFRTNSSNVYLLSLAVVDSLYLILHFMEDTIRTYDGIYFGSDDILMHLKNIKFNKLNKASRE